MTPDQEYGRTAPAPVHVLPELTFDLAEGRPLPATLGKTTAPVHVLPELAFDLRPGEPGPVLQLTVSLRPGATPGEVALDLFRLYRVLNQLELSQRGGGLIPVDALCDVTPTDGTIRVTFRTADPDGAAERLTKLVSAINGAAGGPPNELTPYRSIERWKAQVVADAV
jgi:hypothetical protein